MELSWEKSGPERNAEVRTREAISRSAHADLENSPAKILSPPGGEIKLMFVTPACTTVSESVSRAKSSLM